MSVATLLSQHLLEKPDVVPMPDCQPWRAMDVLDIEHMSYGQVVPSTPRTREFCLVCLAWFLCQTLDRGYVLFPSVDAHVAPIIGKPSAGFQCQRA